MTNALYPSFKSRMLTPGADLVAGLLGAGAGMNPTPAPLKAALLEGYTYSSAHEFFSDVSANLIGSAVAVTGASVAGGVLDADDAIFPTVAAGSTANAVVLFMDTGTEATSPLVLFVNQGSGKGANESGLMAIVTNGDDVPIEWSEGASKLFTI